MIAQVSSKIIKVSDEIVIVQVSSEIVIVQKVVR